MDKRTTLALLLMAALLWCAYDLRRSHEALIPYATLAAWSLALVVLLTGPGLRRDRLLALLLFVEGGAQTASAFLAADLVDRLLPSGDAWHGGLRVHIHVERGDHLRRRCRSPSA